MKKLSLIVIYEQADSLLRRLISFGYAEICEPDDFSSDPELSKLVSRETFNLDDYNANKDSINVLKTQHTMMLTGWLPIFCEEEFASLAKDHLCAWTLEELSEDEREVAPVLLRHPWFFGKYRLAGRREFSPLKAGNHSTKENNDESEADL